MIFTQPAKTASCASCRFSNALSIPCAVVDNQRTKTRENKESCLAPLVMHSSAVDFFLGCRLLGFVVVVLCVGVFVFCVDCL